MTDVGATNYLDHPEVHTVRVTARDEFVARELELVFAFHMPITEKTPEPSKPCFHPVTRIHGSKHECTVCGLLFTPDPIL